MLIMEQIDNSDNITSSEKKNTFLIKYKQFFSLSSLKSPRHYLPIIGVLLVVFGLILSVYLVQKPTNYKSNASSQMVEQIKDANEKLKNMAGSAQASELIIIANQRKDLMLKLIKENPKAFLENTLDASIIEKLPQIAKDNIEKRETLEGASTHLIEDYENSSVTYFFIDDNNSKKRYYLNFVGTIPDITTGPTIKAEAYTLDDQAVILPDENSITLSNNKALGASIGPITRKVLLIRALLSDNQNQTYESTETLGTVFNYTYSANAMHKESSFGLVSLTGTITPYYSVPYTTTDACNYSTAMRSELKQKAAASGYDIASYNHIAFLYPLSSNCGRVASATVGSSPWNTTYQQESNYFGNRYSSNYNASIFAHELGHNLGMHHSTGLNCGTKVLDVYSNCTVGEYADPFDVMGYGYTYYPQNNAGHKYLLGYFGSSNVINVTTSGTYTIYQSETNTSSPQVLRIKKSTGDYYFIDYRRPVLTFDSDFPSTVTSGASIYIVGNVIEGGGDRKTYLLDTTPGDSATVASSGYYNAALVDGKTFSDPASYLTIKQVSHTANSVTLSINYTPPTPTPSPTPTLTPTPTPKPTATPTPVPDNTLPSVSILSPADGTVIEKNSNVTISANAMDNIGISKVLFYVSGVLKCTDAAAPYNCDFKLTGKSGNLFTLTTTAYDKSNNTASASITITSN